MIVCKTCGADITNSNRASQCLLCHLMEHNKSLIDYRTPETIYQFVELINSMSLDGRTICKIILRSPKQFVRLTAKDARGLVRRKLRVLGWKWPRIWNGIREVKQTLKER